MSIYDDIVSHIRRGVREGANFSLRHFWYTCFLGFIIACGFISFVVNGTIRMSEPHQWRSNQWNN